MPQGGKNARRLPQPPEVQGEEELPAAAAENAEFPPSSPEVPGARAQDGTQPEQEPRQGAAAAGNSRGVGPDDRDVPAGPPPTSLQPRGPTWRRGGRRGDQGRKRNQQQARVQEELGAQKGGSEEGGSEGGRTDEPSREARAGAPARSPAKRQRGAGRNPPDETASEAEGERDQAITARQPEKRGMGPFPPRGTLADNRSEQGETSSTITSLMTDGKEEGEWSGEETEQKPTSSRLFQPEHFQRLLTKVISTLNYQMETPDVPRSSASAKLDPRGFKRPVKVQTFSPFPDYFEDVIREEWANPGGGTSLLSLARRFYSLPESTMEDLKVPLIDAPVVALHSGAVMPKDGENALKDAFDRKNENALKKAHEAMSLAIRSAATLSNFTRATAIWADNLLQNPEVSPLVLRQTLLKMKRAAEFAADASQDNIQFCARAQAANIIIRRNIWLKHWKVDSLSKSNLATEKFSGRLLFGESNLDKVLVETREKKKAMPSSSYRRERDTKNRPSRSFRAPYSGGGGRGRDNRDRPFKSFKYGRRPAHKNTATYGPGKTSPLTKQTA
ncbi:UNVERIFIED_CONTAM: hypothetical protein K2H54_048893 [Gekko kuhli]